MYTGKPEVKILLSNSTDDNISIAQIVPSLPYIPLTYIISIIC